MEEGAYGATLYIGNIEDHILFGLFQTADVLGKSVRQSWVQSSAVHLCVSAHAPIPPFIWSLVRCTHAPSDVDDEAGILRGAMGGDSTLVCGCGSGRGGYFDEPIHDDGENEMDV